MSISSIATIGNVNLNSGIIQKNGSATPKVKLEKTPQKDTFQRTVPLNQQEIIMADYRNLRNTSVKPVVTPVISSVTEKYDPIPKELPPSKTPEEPKEDISMYPVSNLQDLTQSYYSRHNVYILVDEKTGIKKVEVRNTSSLPDFYNKVKDFNIKNLALSTDKKGLRGSSIFAKPNKKYMSKLKEAGIDTIIDLRSEAAPKSKKFCEQNEMDYVFFPIMYDEKVSEDTLNNFPKFIEAMNKGNYYIGCNEGTNRTDVAFGLNYLFNKDCKVIPEFLSEMPRKSFSMLMKATNEILGKDKSGHYSYPESFITGLGWDSSEEFEKELAQRISRINPQNK